MQCILQPCRLNPPIIPTGGNASRPLLLAEYVANGCSVPTEGATFFYQGFYRDNGMTDTTDGLMVRFDR